jgi:gamma-glutamyl-gamma-aminobutyrate hydrolase PuuD
VIKPLVLWGGTDISPHLYNETPHPYTQRSNDKQDAEEWYAIQTAIEQGIPIVGICRGAQLLCAYNGGSLHQHTHPHEGNEHPIEVQWGNEKQTFHKVTAGHHQVMVPKGNHKLIGWNPGLTNVFDNKMRLIEIPNCAEIVWWPNTQCLGIQPHPEWSTKQDPFVKWLNNLLLKLDITYSF